MTCSSWHLTERWHICCFQSQLWNVTNYITFFYMLKFNTVCIVVYNKKKLKFCWGKMSSSGPSMCHFDFSKTNLGVVVTFSWIFTFMFKAFPWMPDDSQPAAHTEWKSLNSKNPCILTKDTPNSIIFSPPKKQQPWKTECRSVSVGWS